ncbi:hypothetical protein WAF17_20535 [Bernardetia sp. ABR2-2B]|uniref:hypothetical protein n=1 Tax=Bernardetia sp. ABR2-2B TaxID=3127472 RepID=UPI0030D5BA87
MPQNQFTNKISAFIGIALLLGIIAFTIFINFYQKNTIKEIKKEKFKKRRNQPFAPNELLKFWELEGLRADKIALRTKKQSNIYISISKTIHSLESDSSKDSLFIHYGAVRFSTINSGENDEELTDFKITIINDTYLDLVQRIGNLFIDYQIHSVSILPKSNYSTCINLKDSSKVFLIKGNKKIENSYYKEFVKEARFLNDSTKLYLPKSK